MAGEVNRRTLISLRRLLLYAIITVLAIAFIQPPHRAQIELKPSIINKQTQQVRSDKEQPKQQLVATAVAITKPTPQPKAVEPTPQPVPPGSCEDAIAQIWPATLQSRARLVAQKESSMTVDQVGPINYNGSRDFGCFQINNKAHPDFFASGNWKDPYYNTRYALELYRERGNWSAWYAVRGILW